MVTRQQVGFMVISFIALAAVKAKSKYYDGEIRPYEFGYRIEGNQHRHEKKDENGIINGEFGFITGDGTYHSSVYATDENGNFKLVSLKSSFRLVKSTTTTVPPPPPTTTSAPAPVARQAKQLPYITCSDCKVIEKVPYDKPSPTAADAVAVTVGDVVPSTLNYSTKIVDKNHEDLPKIQIKSHDGTVDTISPLNIALGISTAGIRATEQIKLKHKANSEHSNLKKSNETPTQSVNSIGISERPVTLETKSNTNVLIPSEGTNHRTGKKLEPSKTKLSSNKAINEFIGGVLYRFNYTAGYHGHNEEGDSAGNKAGGYFIIGRDNIKRGVIYVANENGFIPVVKYEKVSSEEAPHEETEKNAGLRGYEFEWFHKGRSKIDKKRNVR